MNRCAGCTLSIDHCIVLQWRHATEKLQLGAYRVQGVRVLQDVCPRRESILPFASVVGDRTLYVVNLLGKMQSFGDTSGRCYLRPPVWKLTGGRRQTIGMQRKR